MKKKKLKKKIKKLEKKVEDNFYILRELIADVDACSTKAIRRLENDNKYYKEWMDRSGVDYKSWFEGENNGN